MERNNFINLLLSILLMESVLWGLLYCECQSPRRRYILHVVSKYLSSVCVDLTKILKAREPGEALRRGRFKEVRELRIRDLILKVRGLTRVEDTPGAGIFIQGWVSCFQGNSSHKQLWFALVSPYSLPVRMIYCELDSHLSPTQEAY